MIANEMLAKFIDIINPYVTDKVLLTDVRADMNLISDLKINSARIIDIVLDLEDMFNIIIDDDSIGRMQTVEGSINVIQEKLALL